ncbi:MAG: 3-isopropylmalate dehydratase large subunit [Candidatus Heimdallarchaeota archaeon LC_3]|nr:MAG: 3-isopropylmalate dehydratase large subunit [Candidatus Heimdallarchaeota archaeon LC_3]
MKLTTEEQEMLDGKHGRAVKKSMEILETLGNIFDAERMIPITSVQVAGVSYANLGEAGLEYLNELAIDGKVRVLTTLNPAGMDRENWKTLGISEEFAKNQNRVLEAFGQMDIITTASCTPYLIGNNPHFGEHIAWAESSAVCYSNSVIGAKTNREGGPSALAAALTGRTPEYGFHLDKNRQPQILIDVKTKVTGSDQFGVLGKVIGDHLDRTGLKIPYITGIDNADLEELKSFCASVATYGGCGLFHMEGVTPESTQKYIMVPLEPQITITEKDMANTREELTDDVEIDFVSIGCPHSSLQEIRQIAKLIEGKKVTKEFWITTARPTKKLADEAGYAKIIEDSGAKFASDTCCVVAPIKGKFSGMMINSGKACFYARGRHKMKVKIASLEDCVLEATS